MNTEDVDLDLLADYVGGALDGTPDESRVARLVDTDPAWGAAYADLEAGMAAVTGRLRALGGTPMPDDVAERLTVALGSFHHAPAPAQEGRHLHAVPSQSSVRAARNRRLRRWAVPVSAAAGVLAFAGFGANYLIGEDAVSETSSAPAAAPGQDASVYSGEVPPGVGNAAVTVSRVSASGADYSPGGLGARALGSMGADKRSESQPAAAEPQMVPEGPVDPALQRLVPRPALIACLTAISAEHGTPFTADVVDYARYQGSPALIVRFTGPDGEWAWVSGPGCGASGAATVTSVKVG